MLRYSLLTTVLLLKPVADDVVLLFHLSSVDEFQRCSLFVDVIFISTINDADPPPHMCFFLNN